MKSVHHIKRSCLFRRLSGVCE